MVWLLVLAVYQAPPDAVDWKGPWKIGITHLVDEQYKSEAECRAAAAQKIERLHEGMLAPIRYRCVAVEEDLPEGAPR
jgi:hypothetical protein